MTAAIPEIETFAFEDAEFEIACEIAVFRAEGHSVPSCKGDPAVWVAWRAGCCDASPRFRLICDYCRQCYVRWQRLGAHISCPWCRKETGGYCAYTPLNKRKA